DIGFTPVGFGEVELDVELVVGDRKSALEAGVLLPLDARWCLTQEVRGIELSRVYHGKPDRLTV
ncbi:MAG: hypothetical protein ACR2OE_14190, partial [Thermomicrobiales bacterium]